MTWLTSALGWLLAAVVRLYQLLVSSWLPAHCNYYPTCSEYTRQALVKHGPLRGIVMGAMRIGRCSSLYHGGNDPVPETFRFDELRSEYRDRRVR